MTRHRSLRCDGEPQTRVAGALRSAGEAPSQCSGVLPIDLSLALRDADLGSRKQRRQPVKKLLIAAMAAAFGAAVVLPAAAIISSNGVYAAQKTTKKAKKKKKPGKMHYKAPTKMKKAA